VIQSACGSEAPDFDRLDLVITGLDTDPTNLAGAQFSIEWQYAYEFETSGSPSGPETGTFIQRVTLRNLESQAEFSHDEPATGIGGDEGVVSVVVPIQDIVSQEDLVQGDSYALRVELDPDDSVLQCGADVDDNDAACLQFSLPGTSTEIDCSAFE
jgi:hypothetical protein